MTFFTADCAFGITPNFNKKTLSHAIVLSSIASLATLTGCQATPSQSQPITSNLTPSQNAHNLMTDMMIHRFDKAYDFEKTTQYHAYPLYAENDLEKNDQSLWFTLLKGYTDKKHKKDASDDEENDREITPAEQKCEDEWSKASEKNDKNLIENKISEKIYEKKGMKIAQHYQQCIDRLPETIKAERQARQEKEDEENPPAIATVTKKDDTIATSEISPSRYQVMVKKIITKLDKLDQNDSAKTKEDAEDSDSELKDLAENSDTYFIDKLKQLKLTPQQIQVLNDSYLAPNLVTYKGSFNPITNQYSTVYEESLHRPFVDTYWRVPVLVDFNEMSLTAEPDVVLPFVGMISLANENKQEQNRLLSQLAGKSVKFTLPEKLKQKIPLNLLKDTLVKSIGQSYADLPAERFSDVTLDDYAKNLHASRAVKLNLTHQDIGYLLGRTMKYWAIELNNVTNQHPEYITNRADFKASLDLLNALNRHYRAEDLAKIAQIVEAVLPLSYNGYNYYYFDSQNNLVGYRKNTDYSSSLFGARMTSTTTSKLNYAVRKDNSHAFYQPKPADIIDGNALVKQLSDSSNLQKEARNARWGYTSEDLSDNKQGYSSAAEAAARTADKVVAFGYAENLKFNKKMGCQKFADSHEDALIAVMPYRYDKNFSTKLPQVQKFINACPAQVEKLETLTTTTTTTDIANDEENGTSLDDLTIHDKSIFDEQLRLMAEMEALKFDKNVNCDTFAQKNAEPLQFALHFRDTDKNYQFENTNIQTFIDTCPAQYQELQSLNERTAEATALENVRATVIKNYKNIKAANAAQAVRLAADTVKDMKDNPLDENMTITSKTYTQDYAQVKRLLNTAKTIKYDPKQNCESFLQDNKAPLVQVFMDYSVGEKLEKDYPNITKFVTACPTQADNLKAVADVEKDLLKPSSEPQPTTDTKNNLKK